MTSFLAPATWRRAASPNWGTRPSTARVSAIVLHADASANVGATLDWLARPESAVSYHVVVDRSGVVHLVVSPDRRAWHAGASALDGVRDCNDYTVGVCLANRNDGREAYPEVQLRSATDVCVRLARHYGIAPARLVRHRDVALPLGRKTDPAPPAFDLAAFRARVEHALRAVV